MSPKQIDRLIERAADKIAAELAKLEAQLPAEVAAQSVMEALGTRLAQRAPTLTAWLESEGAQAVRPFARFMEGRRRVKPATGSAGHH